MSGVRKMSAKHIFKIIIMAAIGSSSIAEAKRNPRDGVNFGIGLRLFDAANQTNGQGDENDSQKNSETTAIHPYLGIVLGDHFNLGISGMFEEQSSKDSFTSKDGDQEIERTSNATMKAGNIFLRFMFAKYMYFEAGIGLYDQRIKITDEYRDLDASGNFTGERAQNDSHGAGPGYHLGGGVEIHITNGFFVTANYLYRAIQLRDYDSDSEIGRKRSRIEKRELTFGLAHYVN